MNKNIKLPKIYINAEFQRLWWTNVSMGLLCGVALVYVLFIAAKDKYSSLSSHLAVVGGMGMSISALVAYVLLERSLKQDIESNAFDQLRMSSLSPWQMVYSRILVAPLLAWVIFILGWLSMLYSVWLSHNYVDENVIAILISLPFIAWAFACMVLTNALQFGRGLRQWSGSFVQLVLAYLISIIFVNYVSHGIIAYAHFDLSKHNLVFYYLTSALLLVIFACIAVHTAMAQRLYLKAGHIVFLGLSLSSPIMFWWGMSKGIAIANIMTLCYGCAAILSVLTQDSGRLAQGFTELKQGRFRLPAWVVLLPLGCLTALWVSVKTMMIYGCQIGGLLLLVLTFRTMGLRYRSVTVAMSVYLLGFSLFMLMR